MRVLVSAASKHGSTEEIGRAIADRIEAAGHEVVVVAPDQVGDLDDVRAAVIGSAVYGGHWVAAAREMVAANAVRLEEIPVWLFSSGPVGDPPKPEEDPVDARDLIELVDPVEHRVFAGRIQMDLLGFGEKAIVKALRAPVGDFRDWAEIEEWSDGIVEALQREFVVGESLPI